MQKRAADAPAIPASAAPVRPTPAGFGQRPSEEHDRHFEAVMQLQKPVRLPGGLIAVPSWTIMRSPNYAFDDAQRSMARKLDASWQPKVSSGQAIPAQWQRCPRIWTDNFVFFYAKGMDEPHLLLGRWTKKAKIYGEEMLNDILVVAAGGHYETMGAKPAGFEPGDMSLRQAADKELKEEVGIDRRNVKYTHYLGAFDDVLREPRAHGVSHVFLRWVEQAPRPSEELKDILSVPVSQLATLCDPDMRVPWIAPDGKELFLGLGHDKLIAAVLTLPTTQGFLAAVRTAYDPPEPAAPFGFAFGGATYSGSVPAIAPSGPPHAPAHPPGAK